MTQSTPPAKWSHIEGLTPIDADPLGEDPHNRDATGEPGSLCLGCWCYSCGGRTDQPRIRRGDTRTGTEIAALGPESPDSHRWCYE